MNTEIFQVNVPRKNKKVNPFHLESRKQQQKEEERMMKVLFCNVDVFSIYFHFN